MIYVGTSGWQYRDWRGAFYPPKLPQKEWLGYYAGRFQVVEVNNTFYNLPAASVFETWHARAPKDFVFGLKMSRYLTHIKRLKEPREPVERFFKTAAGLRDKAGPVLLQLPPNMELDLERLDLALRAMPRGFRVAVEFRDDSWYVEDVRRLLARHKSALCLADCREKLLTPAWRTANWGYVRMHEGLGRPRAGYRDGALREWARCIAGQWGPRQDVYVFFNNDTHCCAVNDARRLAQELQAVGRKTSRVPAADEIQLAA